MDRIDARTRLLGAWTLVTCQSVAGDGSVTYPLGDDALGQLMYDAAGDRVSAQIVRANQARFASDDERRASTGEMCAAWLNYFGYFGTFTVDIEAATVTHHLEAAWFPNLTGTEQVRRYRFEGDELVLDADTAWGQVRNVWRRIQLPTA